MSNEQRSMALFQTQPEGPVLIFPPAARSLMWNNHTVLAPPCWTKK
jgi:hypothetical protein